jgi:hypothetical protein
MIMKTSITLICSLLAYTAIYASDDEKNLHEKKSPTVKSSKFLPMKELTKVLDEIDDATVSKLDTAGKHTVFSEESFETSEESGYDSEEEYKRHQEVGERFFRRLTRHTEARTRIQAFKGQAANEKPFSPVVLDGLSSRTRILLMRELTTYATAHKIPSIPFQYQEKTFNIKLEPSLRQPGSGIMTGIGSYSDIYAFLDACDEDQLKEIAEDLLSARKEKPYHQSSLDTYERKEIGDNLDLNLLNMLLDFEVARRFQGRADDEKQSLFSKEMEDTPEVYEDEKSDKTSPKKPHSFFLKYLDKAQTFNVTAARAQYPQNEWKVNYMHSDRSLLDQVPVASGIVGALRLATAEEEPVLLKQFFHGPHVSYEYRYGELNPFEGRPDGGYREGAVKRIIKKSQSEQHRTHEEIHQDYLETFGGDSESEGESYEPQASAAA